ncbi:MAG TPA: helix-turn-helix domain-containing protein [Blastocatellia bacterium]
MAYSVLWRLKTGRATSVRFDVLVRICEALDCQPGELLEMVNEDEPAKKTRRSGHR